MDIIKHMEFFNPITDIKAPIHIIGLGAIGSTVAEMLVRMGIETLYIYDFDTVSPHNIANQMFYATQINKPKTEAVAEILRNINPAITLKIFDKGYTGQPLTGYIFLCVDNIDLRREICKNNLYNPQIRAVFDFRMRLTDAQHYAADWTIDKDKQALLKTMDFSHDDAKKATPTNACGTSLNIIPTVRTIVSLGLSNFINLVKSKELKKVILIDSFHYVLDSF